MRTNYTDKHHQHSERERELSRFALFCFVVKLIAASVFLTLSLFHHLAGYVLINPSNWKKDLRPINIVRNVAEETRIAPGTSSGRPIEGFFASGLPRDGSPGTVQSVYYTMADTGLVGVGFNNGMATRGATGWVPQVAPPGQPRMCVVNAGLVNHGNGMRHMPSVGAHSNTSDQASDGAGDDSASERKVKFLCSFGGKIFPRPSDGALRYVGGQTKIVSIRRDVSFNELVRKMVNIYGESAVIKYQLPDEDLDALISVSCPDDLENMMEEYERLCERSSDGSAKLRVFLFSASEVGSSGMGPFPDIRDSNQTYFEAVNGLLEGIGVGTTRKESTESLEFGGADAIDSSGQGHGEVNRPPSIGDQSSKESSVHSQEATPKTIRLDQGIHMDNSAGSLCIPVMSGPRPTIPIPMDQGMERSAPVIGPHNHGIDMQPPIMTFPASSTYIHSYGDSPQETMTHTEYVHYPSHLGYPTQIMRTVTPSMHQNQNAPGASPQQFIPTVHVTMPPSSHVSVNQTMFPAHIQPQRFQQVENTSRPRVVQVPLAYNPYQAQFSPQILGAGYQWHQVPHQDQVVFSEGWIQNQQGAVFDNITRFEDCSMCQKALPHAHSDTIAQDQKRSPASNMAGSNPSHYSLQLDGKGRPEDRFTIGDYGEMPVGQLGTAAQLPQVEKMQAEMLGVAQNFEGNFIDDGYVSRKEGSSDQPMPQGAVGLTGGLQSPIGMVTAAIPQTYQDNDVLSVGTPMQYQIRHDAVSSGPVGGDHPITVAISSPLSDNQFCEQPKHYYSNIAFIVPEVDNQESYAAYDHQILMERGMENLQIHPFEIISSNEQNKVPADSLKREDVQENRLPRGGDGETSWNTNFRDHHTANDGNQLSQIEMLPVSANETSASFQPPPYGVGGVEYNSNSLFSHQDPWNFQQDTHLPPPRGQADFRLRDRLSAFCHCSDEFLKQELQAVAEGVAASVFQSPTESQENTDVKVENEDHFEEVEATIPEKKIHWSPLSEDIGHLQNIKNTDLEELRELGSGTFGTVYHGTWRGTDVAIKRINDRCFTGKPSEQDRMRDDFWNEAIKLADLHHPNVVAFYGVVLDGPGGSVATVTEFMVNGSLRTSLQKKERNLDKRKRLLIAMDVAFGMEYLHGKNIVHFDLKSDNLLVNLRDPHRPICKVGDLGLSKVKCKTLISGGVRGTLPWMAPELLNGSSSLVSEKVDVYSYGIVLWELLTGEEPYADLHYGAIIGGIVSNTLRPPIPESCDQDWRSLMERCWSSEPQERPNFTEVANDLRTMASTIPPKGQMQQQSN
ncbi:hypothetical protein Leryth_007385 [Lithospermum erythrorhizon]|nr:hypothetical protein Leryth_007385 [Lithospermum erythrorhizon]